MKKEVIVFALTLILLTSLVTAIPQKYIQKQSAQEIQDLQEPPVALEKPSTICKGDANLDGEVSQLDVDAFVSLLGKKLINAQTDDEKLLVWIGDFNEDGIVNFKDIDAMRESVKGNRELTCFDGNQLTKVYDFVAQNNINAYQCRLGPFPTTFPTEITKQVCNKGFTDLTKNSNLKAADKKSYGGGSWTNYAAHHLFVLKDVDENKLKKFNVQYVIYNRYQYPTETHYLYVRNFDSGEWEQLSTATVSRLQQGTLNYESSDGGKSAYVNADKEMWFLGTESVFAGNAANTDYFKVKLLFACNNNPYCA